MSSFGAAPLRIRSMRVEANLLADWLEQRSVSRGIARQSGLKTLCGVSIAAFAVVFCPQWATPIQIANAKLASTVKALDVQLHAAGLDKAAPQAGPTPASDPATILKQSQAKSRGFLNAASRMLNASTGSMVLNTMRYQVSGGVLSVTGQGDAADFESANEFIKRLSAVPHARESALTSTQRSTNLGPNGVAFQFQHSCEVVR